MTLKNVRPEDLYDLCELAQSVLCLATELPTSLFAVAESIKDQCLPLCEPKSKPSEEYRLAEKAFTELLKINRGS